MTQKPSLDRGSIWLDLRGVREGTHSLVLSEREQALTVDEGTGKDLRDFEFDGEISFDGKDYRVCGSLDGTLETACDRCVTTFGREIRAEVEFRARPEDPRSGPAAFEDGVIDLGPDRQLDLAIPLRAAAILEVPIKNVCREDCRGICPVCGTNRNLETCECNPKSGDPRWDVLRGLSSPSEPKE
ncbi:MAG: DUF177 domain-containing protein [Gemmatimonadetes bacterium]|nr:DUF177 domain-containing protein [Gemmatimonadota bacterium]